MMSWYLLACEKNFLLLSTSLAIFSSSSSYVACLTLICVDTFLRFSRSCRAVGRVREGRQAVAESAHPEGTVAVRLERGELLLVDLNVDVLVLADAFDLVEHLGVAARITGSARTLRAIDSRLVAL